MNKKNITKITNFIHIIRNQKVMLDRDLADLYGVEVKALNQAVKRNEARFPLIFNLDLPKQNLFTHSHKM